MKRWRLIVDSAEKELGTPQFQNARSGDVASDLKTLRIALDVLARKVRGLGSVPFARRITLLRQLIDLHGSSALPEVSTLIVQAFSRHDAGSGEAPELRALEHTLVSALLFIGIIGTFFGLIAFLDSENLAKLLTFSSNGSGIDHLSGFTQGLGTAFWTSLFAYVFYLAGRLVTDLCDEEFESSVQSFTTTIQNGLTYLFPAAGRATVDLSDQSIGLLAATVQVLKETAGTVHDFVRQIKAIANQLSVATNVFNNGVRQATDDSKNIFTTIKASQEEMKAAAAEWKAASESFSKTAGPLATDIQALLAEIRSFPSVVGAQVQAMTADLTAHAKSNADSLTDHVQAIGNRLDKSATNFADQMDRFSEELQSRFTGYDKVMEAVTANLGEVLEQRRDLADKLKRLHEDSSSIRQGTLDAVKSLATQDQQRMRELKDALLAMAEQLKGLDDRQRQTIQLLLGEGGSPEDLLSILRILNDRLSSMSARSFSLAD